MPGSYLKMAGATRSIRRTLKKKEKKELTAGVMRKRISNDFLFLASEQNQDSSSKSTRSPAAFCFKLQAPTFRSGLPQPLSPDHVDLPVSSGSKEKKL